MLLELFVPVQPSDSLVVNVEEEVSAPSFFQIDSVALNQILENPLKDWRLEFYLEGDEYIVHLQRTQIYSGSTEVRSVSGQSIIGLFEPKHFLVIARALMKYHLQSLFSILKFQVFLNSRMNIGK